MKSVLSLLVCTLFSLNLSAADPFALVGSYTLKSISPISQDADKYIKYCTDNIKVDHDVNRGFRMQLVGLWNPAKANYLEYQDHSGEALTLDSSQSSMQYRVHTLSRVFSLPNVFVLETQDGFITQPQLKVSCIYSKK